MHTALVLLLTACAQDDALLPLADAGLPVVGATGQQLAVDGDDSLGWSLSWSFAELPADSRLDHRDLWSAESPWPSFVPDVPGDYRLALEVCDGEGLCDRDEVLVHAEDVALRSGGEGLPEKRLGAHHGWEIPWGFKGGKGFGGKSSGGEGFLGGNELRLTHDWEMPWEFKGGKGSGEGRSDSGSPPDVPGDYWLMLEVCDGEGLCDSDEVLVRAEDVALHMGEGRRAPGIALKAYNDWEMPWEFKGGEGFGGKDSFREGPSGVSSEWEVPWGFRSGEPCGDEDAEDSSSPDGPIEADNSPPTASVVVSATRSGTGPTLHLDASDSSDPDGDRLRFTWSLVGLPADSLLNSGDVDGRWSEAASFQPDVAGTWTLRLRVDDGRASDVVDLTVAVSGPSPTGE